MAQPLPAPPPPKAGAIPPSAAAKIVLRPGAPGSDLPGLPPAPRGVHFHDGFYLRMAVGLGLGGTLVSSDAKSVGDYSIGGGGGALDLWIGGTPTPGFAMGAAISAVALNSAKRRVDGHSIPGDVNGGTALLGYFVDVFPDPEAGLHFGGALGLASGTAEVKGSGRKFEGSGVGLEAFGGYDLWVSPQWSIGGLARFVGSVTRDTQNGVAYEASMGAFTLSFTALYH
jgi:hypothetical protein